MKFLLLALSALALASAQTTTVTTTLGVTMVGNADGSATISVGTGPGVTIPATAVTAVKAIVALINTAVSGVTAGSNIAIALPISVDTTTGAVSVTFGGNTYTLDQATFAGILGLQRQLFQALGGVVPRPRPVLPTRGPFVGYRGRRHSDTFVSICEFLF
ncbi:hypothetical protein pipiens_005194 [Culex pipiens pipiens]|uniref:Uncharacterized protein n=1 Tax=Culex pipiens pipiens TaxID=38569 RepID=A0ABD1CB34_CULPP